MRRLTCQAFGDPPTLVVEEVEDPRPGPGEVVVRVDAAKVSFVDRLLVQGRYQARPALPFTPGTVAAGTVIGSGPGLTGDLVGSHVAALALGYGAYSTHVVVPADSIVPLPGGLLSEAAAGGLEAYGTASFALGRRGGLRSGERVLVLGASGAVGHAAADLACALGADVLCVSSDPVGCRQRLPGLHAVLDRDDELREHVRELWPDGVDLVVDPVGGPAAGAALRSLRQGGRYLVLGFASGEIPALPLNQVLLRNRQVVGVEWGGFLRGSTRAVREELASVLDRLAGTSLHPLTAEPWGLDELPAVLGDESSHPRLSSTIVVF